MTFALGILCFTSMRICGGPPSARVRGVQKGTVLMPKDMRTEKHHQNDFAILGRTYGVSPTCCLWNATVIISNFGIMSSIFPKFNIIFRFRRRNISVPSVQRD